MSAYLLLAALLLSLVAAAAGDQTDGRIPITKRHYTSQHPSRLVQTLTDYTPAKHFHALSAEHRADALSQWRQRFHQHRHVAPDGWLHNAAKLRHQKAHRAVHAMDSGNTDGYSNPAVFAAKYTQLIDSLAPTSLLPLTSFSNAAYEAYIYLGTPAQPALVVLDTGSSDLWILGQEAVQQMPSAANNYTRFFDSSASSTFHNYSSLWEINYAQGPENGYLASDTMSIASYSMSNQTLGIGTAFGDAGSLPSQPLDGVMGLAFPATLTDYQKPYPTVLQHLYDTKQISSLSFSFVMSKSSENQAEFGDDAEFHGQSYRNEFIINPSDSINQQLSPQGFTTLQVTDASTLGFYFTQMDNVLVDGQADGQLCSMAVAGRKSRDDNSCWIVWDSGTSLITFPPPVYDSFATYIATGRSDCIYDQSGSGSVTCDINSFGYDGLPVLTFVLNGTNYQLTPQQYFQSNTLGIEPLDLNSPGGHYYSFILGDVFLQSVYSVFSQTSQTVKISSPQPAATAALSTIPKYYSLLNTTAQTLSVPIESPDIFWNPPSVDTYLAVLPSYADTEASYSGSGSSGSGSDPASGSGDSTSQTRFKKLSQGEWSEQTARRWGVKPVYQQ